MGRYIVHDFPARNGPLTPQSGARLEVGWKGGRGTRGHQVALIDAASERWPLSSAVSKKFMPGDFEPHVLNIARRPNYYIPTSYSGARLCSSPPVRRIPSFNTVTLEYVRLAK